MPFYYPLSSSVPLRSKTLIVPVVSVGNVSQLAADLLIATLELEQIGVFDSQDLVPVVGAREDGAGISTPLELYGKEGVDLLVIQQRSPVLKSRKAAFTASLLKFVQENGVSAVLYLTGVDLTNRSDSQMLSPTYALTAPGSPALESSPISLISQLPTYKFESSESPAGAVGQIIFAPSSQAQSSTIPFIPGGGLTRRLLALSSSSSQKKSVPTAAILQFVLEGDNRADAEFFAGVIAGILKLRVERWRQPASWKVGLFGTPHDQTLYG